MAPQLKPSASALYIVLLPDLTIVDASDEYRRTTLLWNEPIHGRDMFDVFPDNPNDPAASGVRQLRESLAAVLRTGNEQHMPVHNYDVRDHVADEGGWVEKHWLATNYPVYDAHGREITHIIREVVDVTRAVQLQRWVHEQIQIVGEQRETLRHLKAEVDRQWEALRDAASHVARVFAVGTPLGGSDAALERATRELGAPGPPEDQYLAGDQRTPVSGIYRSYHGQKCELASTRLFSRVGQPLPRCPRCQQTVMYRLIQAMDVGPN